MLPTWSKNEFMVLGFLKKTYRLEEFDKQTKILI